nr:uncharacterized protein LOC111856150 [Paramormyrops kingsleyae]
MIPKFMEHCFIKRQQANAYKEERSDATDEFESTKALLQVDFAENFTCWWQDEIQTGHWHHGQVSMFTVALWYDGSLHPFVLASDNLTHSKDTIVAYMDCILSQLPDHVQKLSVWSDGPALQFKNRFIAAVLEPLQAKHHVEITWIFFATCHGKGPVDGIGGGVKRLVWNGIRCRKYIVNNASTFTEAAASSNVRVLEIKPSEIEAINESLCLEQVFKNAPAIAGISDIHCMKMVDGNIATFLLTSDMSDQNNEMQEPGASQVPVVGEWWAVSYEGEIFPVKVQKIEKGEYQVKVMVAAGKNWKWPNTPD